MLSIPGILIVAGIALAGAAALASVRDEDRSVTGGSITFVRSTGRTAELFSVDVRARTERSIVTGAGSASSPAWSPDGSRLAYARRDPTVAEGYAVEVLEARTGRRSRLTSGESIDGSPTWSPDGEQIAFSGNADGPRFGIYIVSRTGGELRFVTHGHTPAWSPVGTAIALVRVEDGRSRVYVVGSDGTGLRAITGGAPNEDRDPSWSPDGRQLAVSTISAGPDASWDLAIIDADTGRRRTLALTTTDERYPAWSPGGDHIVFARIDERSAGIWWVHVRTGQEQRLTTSDKFDLMPSWRLEQQRHEETK